MAHPRLRGFSARRKDLTVTVERTVETKIQVLNKKGEPVIENGKPKYNITKTTIKENPIRDFNVRVNNAVPLDHKMLR
jgi:hypothetical protein